MGNILTATMVRMAEISTVARNTIAVIPIMRLSLSEGLIFDMADEMAKKTRGITAVNKRFKNISPMGFSTSTFFPNTSPAILPTAIPVSNQMIPL
ncbi:hypothetical protein D3C87_1252360 [compost metagenome]